jgi:osmotically-inducible protein OsmY
MAVERERTFSGDRDRWEDDDAGGLQPDDQILAALWRALRDDPDLDASALEVTVRTGEVTLAGSVDDPRHKVLAEAHARQIDGVADVFNTIAVREPVGGGSGP